MEQNIYFIVGIKGVAMCHIAVILKKMGKEVEGADVAEEFITDHVLADNGITCQTGFDAQSLPAETQVVVYSAAHGGTDNPIVKEAEKRGIRIVSQPDFLGELIAGFKFSIAVCGTHGKTNTSSLLSYALIQLGAKPSYMVGSSTFDADGKTFPGGDFNGPDYFVIEADEYGVNPPKDKTPKFHSLSPSHILCLNVDFDHPDMYDTIDDVKRAFTAFFERAQTKVIYCADDAVLADALSGLQSEKKEGYGLSEKAEYRIVHSESRDGKTVFSLENEIEPVKEIELAVYGEKNVSNAAGVIAILLNLGFMPDEIKKAVRGFTGSKRRLEVIFEKDGTTLIDDYGHHPKEIEVTTAALRSRFPGRRVITVFQPHTFSRTKALKADFITALAKSDIALILPVFASAREQADTSISSVDLANGMTVFALNEGTNPVDKLKTVLKKGDVVVTMGAGDVYKLGADIIELIKSL